MIADPLLSAESDKVFSGRACEYQAAGRILETIQNLTFSRVV
jgi:hypothetical protein